MSFLVLRDGQLLGIETISPQKDINEPIRKKRERASHELLFFFRYHHIGQMIQLFLQQFIKAFDDAPYALHLVWSSSKNIDRICVLFRACLRRGKTLVIDPYTANVLAAVAKLNPKIPSATTAEKIKVYFPPRLTSRLMERDQKRYIYSLNPRENKVTHADLSATPERYVMLVRPSVLEFLQKIKAKRIRFVRSIWDGYWEEAKIERFRRWVEANCEQLPDIHSSGHADIASLQRIVGHVKPKHLVPIHTDAPAQFKELLPEQSILLPNNNEAVALA